MDIDDINYAYAKSTLHGVVQIFIDAARSSNEESNIPTPIYRDIERYLLYLSLRLDTKNTKIYDDALMSHTEKDVIKSLLDFFDDQFYHLERSDQPKWTRLEELTRSSSKNEVFKRLLSGNSSKQRQFQHLRSWIEHFSRLRDKLDSNLDLSEPENGAIAELNTQLPKVPTPGDLLDHAKYLNESLFHYWSCSHVAPREASLFLADFGQPGITGNGKSAKFRMLLSSAKGFKTWKWADVTVDTKNSRSNVLPRGACVAVSCKHSGESPEQRDCICSVFERAGRLSLQLQWVDEDLRTLILNAKRPKQEEFKISNPVSVGFEELLSILKKDASDSKTANLNQLAMTLAYTFSYLYDDNDSIVSWICTDWFGYYEDSNRSIQRWIGPDWLGRVRFLYHSEVYFGNDGQTPKILWPYLYSRSSIEETPTFDEKARRDLQHGFPSLLALGIGLLKIQQMRAGEDMLFAPNEDFLDDGKPNINSDLNTAMAILRRLKYESKSRLGFVDTYFLDAIDACLNPDMREISDEATRPQVRKYVRERVVHYLNLNSFTTSPSQKQMEHFMQGASLHDTSNERKVADDVSTSKICAQEAKDCLSDDVVEKRADRECLEADGWCKKFEEEVFTKVQEQKEKKKIQSFGKVKVAILDTGLEVASPKRDKWLKDKRVVYKTWVKQENGSDWEDKVGHGTHSACLLVKFAPDAKIHVARVFEEQEPKEHELFYIAEAIDYAVREWKVDIITMSFGVSEATSNEASREKISKALKHAHSNNVIMFAAASNEGLHKPVPWPARALEVISVHSASGKGWPSRSSPRLAPHGLAVCTLGESVESDWLPTSSNPKKSNTKRKDGTSTATPIAAAIAAVVIDYADAIVDLRPTEKKQLRSSDGMFAVFKLMMAEGDESHWLMPEKLFEKPEMHISYLMGDKLRGK